MEGFLTLHLKSMEPDQPKNDESPRPRIGRMEKTSLAEGAVFVEGEVAGDITPSVTPTLEGGGEKNVIPLADFLRAKEIEELGRLERLLREGKELRPSELKKLKAAARAEGAEGRGPARGRVCVDEAVGDAGVNAWWVNGGGGTYFVRENEACWLEVPENKLELMLKRRGVSSVAEAGEFLSPMEVAKMAVMEKRTLDRAIEALAGYGAGIFEVKGRRILIRTGPKLIEPKQGTWEFIEQFIAGRLMLDGGSVAENRVQFDRFNYWMKRGVMNYYASPEVWLNSHILVLAGPAGCGKSRLQHNLITPIFGGRSADPSLYVFGDTSFNEGWMGASHLLIEDPKPSTKMLDRLQLAQILKGLAVNEDHSYHAKNRGEFIVDPQFVVSISINDDPDALRILPALTPDFADKVMLLHVQDRDFPMPTGSGEERRAFQDRIAEELPAYVHWLLHECVVPEGLQCDRFGVRYYHEPELKLSLWEDSPASELLALLDVAKWREDGMGQRGFWMQEGAGTVPEVKARGVLPFERPCAAKTLIEKAQTDDCRVWLGSAETLQQLMEGCLQRSVADKLIKHNSMGRLLARLAEDCPDRVSACRVPVKGYRLWLIKAPEPQADVTDDD